MMSALEKVLNTQVQSIDMPYKEVKEHLSYERVGMDENVDGQS